MTLRINVRRLSSPSATLLQNLQLDIPAGTVHTLPPRARCVDQATNTRALRGVNISISPSL
jgi:hypothetical protein